MNNEPKLDEKTIQYLIDNGLLERGALSGIEKSTQTAQTSNVYLKSAFSDWSSQLDTELNENIAKIYKTYVQKYFEFVSGLESFVDISDDFLIPVSSIDDYRRWFDHLGASGYSFHTIRRYKHALQRFIKSVLLNYGVGLTSLDDVSIQADTNTVDALRDDEIRAMAMFAKDVKTKAIILFMYETGMRRNELCDCKNEHIDFEYNRVNIYNHDKLDRVGFFSDEMAELLKEYVYWWKEEIIEINRKRRHLEKLKGRKYVEFVESEFLFQSLRTEQITHNKIYNDIKETAMAYYLSVFLNEGHTQEEAEAFATEQTKKVSPETLRHSRRAYWFSQGKTVDQVQSIMSDENRWMCRRYMRVAQILYPESFVH